MLRRAGCALLCAAWLGGCASAAPSEGADVSVAFADLNRAYQSADVAALERLITEDYIHTNGAAAPIGREQWLSWNRTRAERHASGAWSTDTYDVTDVSIHQSGDRATITGIVRSTGMRDGAPTSVGVRFTALWVLQNGAWRRAAFHDTALGAGAP